MTPSQRQLIKEAYQAGYYGALNEAPSRTTLRFLKRLAAKVAKEMNFDDAIDALKKRLDDADDIDLDEPIG